MEEHHQRGLDEIKPPTLLSDFFETKATYFSFS